MSQGLISLPVTGTFSGLSEQVYINTALDALATLNSGSSAPTTGGTGLVALSGILWRDTSVTPNVIRLRNDADDTWIPICAIDQTGNVSAAYTGGKRAVTGTSDTILATDLGKFVTFTNAAAIAVTLPQATTAGFGNGFWMMARCLSGSVGTVTITPTTSTIDAAATLTLPPGQSCIIVSDGTNYFTMGLTKVSVIPENLSLTGVISPTQIAANTDNWAPTGFATASVIRASTDASRDLTGIAGGATGRTIFLQNVGSFDLVLTHDATSTAANRFYCPNGASYTVKPNAAVVIVYDATSSRWRVIDAAAASSVSIAILQDQKADGTQGGAGTNTTWTNRDLNTELSDPSGIVTISGNQFTLISGTYLIIYFASFYSGASGQKVRHRLYNVTDAASISLSGSNFGGTAQTNGSENGFGYISTDGTKAYAVQYYKSAGSSAVDLGADDAITVGVEVYTQVTIIKIG